MSHQGPLFSPAENSLQGKPPLKIRYVPITYGAIWLWQGLELIFKSGWFALLAAVLFYIIHNLIMAIYSIHMLVTFTVLEVSIPILMPEYDLNAHLVMVCLFWLKSILAYYIIILIAYGLVSFAEQKYQQGYASIGTFFSGVIINAINLLRLLIIFTVILIMICGVSFVFFLLTSFMSFFMTYLFNELDYILMVIVVQAICTLFSISALLIVFRQLSVFKAISTSIFACGKNILAITFFQLVFVMIIKDIQSVTKWLLSDNQSSNFNRLLFDAITSCLFIFIILYFSMSMYAVYKTIFPAEQVS